MSLTNNHDIEVEPLANTLAVPLVREIGKADIAGKLAADNIAVVVDYGDNGSCGVVVRIRLSRLRRLRYWRRRTVGGLRGGGRPSWRRSGAVCS